MGIFGFRKRTGRLGKQAALPVLEALFFRASAQARPALAAVGEPGGLALPAAQPAGRYELVRLDPPGSLLQWAQAGARFDLSRAGALRIWQDGRIRAAERPEDCLAHGGRLLEPGECRYLDAYLDFTGRRWSDPDLHLMPDES